jgi:hypothetical protein
MEVIKKVSLSQIVYLAAEEDISARKFNTYLRYAYRAIELMGTIGALSKFEYKKTVSNGRIVIDHPAEFFYVRSISINGQRLIYAMDVESIAGSAIEDQTYGPTYTVSGNTIILNKVMRASMEGKQAVIDLRAFDLNEEGEPMVPSVMQEAIIWYIRKEEAYRIYQTAKGRFGRGLFKDAEVSWKNESAIAMQDIDTPSDDERQLIHTIWHTKSPLNSARGYKNFNSLG